RSVPCSRMTWYCSGVSSPRHSRSVFSIFVTSFDCSTSTIGRLFQEAGDQPPCDAEGGRPVVRVGHPVDVEPAGLSDLRLLYGDLAATVPSEEADHKLAWKRPGLTSEVADVLHLNADFLADLAGDRLLQRLAGLDESGQKSEEAEPEPLVVRKQDLITVA